MGSPRTMQIEVTILPREFYFSDDTLTIAKRALGKIVVRETDQGPISGRIVETEGYQVGDPACHAYGGETERNRAMFGEPGHAYVYFTYGMHFMLNLVCAEHGMAEAVLIRALEPLVGVDQMRLNRGAVGLKEPEAKLCAGPGKFAQALGITRTLFNHVDLTTSDGGLYLLDAPEVPEEEIVATTRIGITRGAELPWRYYVRSSKSVSRR